jgi:hypothetical protein
MIVRAGASSSQCAVSRYRGKGGDIMTKHQNRGHCLLGLLIAAALLLMTAASGLCLNWSPEELVGGDDDYDDYGVSMTATSDGTIWVVWTGTDPAQGDKEVYYSVRSDSGWSQRARVHANNAVEDGVPEIDSGEDGVPWVIWTRKHEGAYDLVASHRDGAAWTPYQVVREGGDRYDTYAIEVVSSSDIWVVTDAFVEGHEARWLLVYHWDGVAWSDPWLVGHPGTDRSPAIRMAPDGRPWLVWIAFGLSGEPLNAVAYSVFEDGAWSTPAVIDGDPGNGGLGPEILFDVDGAPIVAWEGNGHLSAGYDVVYSRLLDGVWTPAELVSEPRTSWYQTNVGLHSDQDFNGSIWLFWVSADGDDFHAGDVKVCPWLGSGWGTEEAACDTTHGKVDSSGDIAVAPDGSLWAAWEAYVEVAPYDYFVLASHGTCVTAVDFCCLEAERRGGSVDLTWYASGSAASGPFRVWREASPGAEDMTSQPAAGAMQLAGTWQTLGTTRNWTDLTTDSQLGYAYWVEWTSPGGSAHLGPAVVPATATWKGPARLLGVLPNPSRDGCTIAYELAQAGGVVVEIYDTSGRAVRRL